MVVILDLLALFLLRRQRALVLLGAIIRRCTD
jgi:hypothetical protein